WGGRPGDVPRLAAVAGSDVRPRLVMNGNVRVPSPRTVMRRWANIDPNVTMARYRLLPVRNGRRRPCLRGERVQGRPCGTRACLTSGNPIIPKGFFSMGTATSAKDFSSVRTVEVGPERDGQRVDNCLATLLKGVPKTHIY